MKRSIFLDYSLPVFADKDLIKRYSSFLLDSVKHLEKSINLKFYFSLNLFSQIHCQDEFKALVPIIKNLLESDRAEMLVDSNFNLSRSVSESSFSYDYLLNEYFISYHFGHSKDFEGDSCMMVKNLHTVSGANVEISSSMLSAIEIMGYKRVFISSNISNTPVKFKNIQFIPLNMGLGKVFEGFVTHESVKEFIDSVKESIIYLNVFDLVCQNLDNLNLNFSNLLYFLDRGNYLFELTDIDDENMKFQETVPSNMLYDISNEAENNFSITNQMQKSLSGFLSFRYGTFDGIEDYYRVPVWAESGLDLIDKQNLFNISLMSLLSRNIDRKNILLNSHLRSHLNDIIDRLLVMGITSKELDSLLLAFKDEINQN